MMMMIVAATKMTTKGKASSQEHFLDHLQASHTIIRTTESLNLKPYLEIMNNGSISQACRLPL